MLRHPFFELDSKQIQRSFSITNLYRLLLADVVRRQVNNFCSTSSLGI